MNAAHALYFERILIGERIRTLGALHHLEADESEPQGASAGNTVRSHESLADAASETLEQETDFALVTRFSERLAAIDTALVTLREHVDQFAVCCECGESIGSRRLQLVPWTTVCGNCAECPVEAQG